MLDHGCTTVILAITEFDMDFWFPNIPKIVDKAHELGACAARTLGYWHFGGKNVIEHRWRDSTNYSL
jgi:hypothetical protein